MTLPSPYIGLRPFESADSHLFFGRIEQTTEALESLYHHRFVAVVGSSGCGKSSLIKAGIIPALLGGFLVNDRSRWRIARLTPGDSPIRNLAEAVCQAMSRPVAEVNELLADIEERQLHALIDYLSASMTEGENLFVLVDQFEEIFAFRGRDDERAGSARSRNERRDIERRRAEAGDFVDLVLALSRRQGAPVYVVLTMRSDFLGDCDVFYGLPEAMNRGRYLVPRLTRHQLTEAIEGPAKLFGAAVSGRLLDRLLNELGDRFDRLPVLQHVLVRTWDAWNGAADKGPIDITHYESVGTLEHALGEHAKEALGPLRKDPLLADMSDEQFLRTVGRVFQSLTETDSAGRQVKRPARLHTIVAETSLSDELVLAILSPFRDAGFVFPGKEAQDRDPRFELSHESLIRQWDQLAGWVNAERDSRDHYLELTRLAAGAAMGERALLQNPDLGIKLAWRHQNHPVLPWAQRYSKNSSDLPHALDYLEQSRRALERTWWIRAAVVASAFVVLVALLSWALLNWNRAIQATTIANEQTRSAVEAKSYADGQRDDARRQKQIADENARRADENAQSATAANANLQNQVEQTRAALRAVTEARTAENQRSFEARGAGIAAGFGGYTAIGSDAQGRQTLWDLATGPDELRLAALRAFLASEAAADRFSQASDTILHAMLGYGPVGRIEPIVQVFGEKCITMESGGRGRQPLGACRTLAEAIGASPPNGIKTRLAGAVVAFAEPLIAQRNGELPQSLSTCVLVLDRMSLATIFTRALEAGHTRMFARAVGPSLQRTAERLPANTRHAFAEALLDGYRSAGQPKLGYGDTEFLGQQAGFFSDEDQARLVGLFEGDWAGLPNYQKIPFAYYSRHLNDSQALDILTALLAQRYLDTTALQALIAGSDAARAARFGEEFISWLARPERPQQLETETPRLIAAFRDHLTVDQVRRTSEALAAELESASNQDLAYPLAREIGEISATPGVNARAVSTALEHAFSRFRSTSVLTPALGLRPNDDLALLVVEWLLAEPKAGPSALVRRREVPDIARRLSGDALATLTDRAIREPGGDSADTLLSDLMRAAGPNKSASTVDRVIMSLRQADDKRVVERLADSLARSKDVMSPQQSKDATAVLLEKIDGSAGDATTVIKLAQIATAISIPADSEHRRRLAQRLVASMSDRSRYVDWLLAMATTPLSEYLDSRQWQAVADTLFSALSKRDDDYSVRDTAVALATASDRLLPEQAWQAARPLLESIKKDRDTARPEVIAAAARLGSRLREEQRRETRAALNEFIVDTERIISGADGSYFRGNLIEAIPAAWPLLDAEQRRRATLTLAELLRRGAWPTSSGLPASFVNFAIQQDLVTARAMTSALLQRLEQSSQSAAEIVALVLRLSDVRNREKQVLLNALKWPTLSAPVHSVLKAELANRGGDNSAVDFDRWRFAEWARRQGLDTTPLVQRAEY